EVAKTEPRHENQEFISGMFGKVYLRKLHAFPQNDAEAFRYSGALCRANQRHMQNVKNINEQNNHHQPNLNHTQQANYNTT
ncbi:PrkA family serine protein kinase, partial [Pseudomonas syringae pv. tagetis]